ncbi:MAG: DUF3842 family protein, partial [Candidatus Promineifilaceae bacterium]
SPPMIAMTISCFVATATVLSSSVYVVWQIIQLALGERADTDLAINLGQAVGYFIVAVAVWIYHGSILRREGAILKQEVASKQIAVRVAVIDDDDGSLGAALVNQIKAKVPSAQVQLLPLGSAAKEAVNGDGPKESPVQILADAEVIVGPWHMAVTGSVGGMVTESIAQTITSSPAQKVLIPVRKEGWSWTGVERWKVQDIVKEAAGAVEQLAAGNQLQERRKLSPVVIIIAVLIGLCLIGSIVPGLIALFVDSLMY